MKKLNVVAIIIALFATSLSAAYVASTPAVNAGGWVSNGSIVGTPHDLSGSISGAIGSDDNGEICVYCHTPHGANSGFDGAPLWNKSNITTTGFTMYGATAVNTAGTTIAGTDTEQSPASPSLACLSCHDGVSAVDSIVNAPGSGLGNLAASSTLLITDYAGNDNANIGVNLANDHPVSIALTPGKASLRDLNSTLTNFVGAATVGDLLRGTLGLVECGSCHDPHNGYALDQLGAQVNYLRASNVGSALCLGCHDK